MLMAKLYFYYASMNAGKSTVLLQSSFNYRERGMRTLLFTAALDNRSGVGVIASRIGLEAPATPFSAETDLGRIIAAGHAGADVVAGHAGAGVVAGQAGADVIAGQAGAGVVAGQAGAGVVAGQAGAGVVAGQAGAGVVAGQAGAGIDCVLIDEAQFLTVDQVWQLARVCDDLGIPVLCYGLRTDFLGALFPGSAALLAIADALHEIKSVCVCGRKAIMNLRIDAAGRAVAAGAQTEIGGNDRYVALCRRHFTAALAGQWLAPPLAAA
jgi:thymidine kinase